MLTQCHISDLILDFLSNLIHALQGDRASILSGAQTGVATLYIGPFKTNRHTAESHRSMHVSSGGSRNLILFGV